MKYIFNLDLTKVDIAEYIKNPIVTLEFNQKLIGKATISGDKKSVKVDFFEDQPVFYTKLAESYEVKGENKILRELSLVLKNNYE